MWLLFAVICVYSALDVYQTKMLFDCGAHEANPILRWLIESTGTWLIIIFVKLILLAVLGHGMWIVGGNKKCQITQK
jgi:hypothetical protein